MTNTAHIAGGTILVWVSHHAGVFVDEARVEMNKDIHEEQHVPRHVHERPRAAGI